MNLLPPVIPPRARSRPGSSTITAKRNDSRPGSSSQQGNIGQRSRNGSADTIGLRDPDDIGVTLRRPSDEPIRAGDQVDKTGSGGDAGEIVSEFTPDKRERKPTSYNAVNQVGLPSDSMVSPPGRTTDPELGSIGVESRTSPSLQVEEKKQVDPIDERQTQLPDVPPSSISSSSSLPPSTLTPTSLSNAPQTSKVVPDRKPNEPITHPASLTSSTSDSKRKPSADSLVIPTRTTSRVLTEDVPVSIPSTSTPTNAQKDPSKTSSLVSPPLISPFSSPSMPDGFDPTFDPHQLPPHPTTQAKLGHGLPSRESLRGEERRSSEMDLSSLTTGTGTGTSGFSSPTVTPPEQDSLWAGQGGKCDPALAHGQSKVGVPFPPPQSQTQGTYKFRTGSGSSSANIFFKRPSAPQTPSTNSLHSLASSTQQGTRSSSVTPGATTGYVNARMAREEERRVELEQKRERENRKEGNGTIGVVKDGYKIVDGVEKKRSTSGVYTPATFPGATGKPRAASATSSLGLPSPRTPETPYLFQTPTPPPIPDSSTSTYFPRQFSGTSPARAGYSTGEQEAAINKKRSIIGGLKSPSFTGMKSAMTDGWRRSSADAVSNPSRLDATAPTLRSRLASAHDVHYQSGDGHSMTDDRSRRVSDQPFRPGHVGRAATAVDGLGLALSDRSSVDSGYPIKVPMELLEASASTRASMDVSDVPLANSATPSLQGRPRNIKGLTLPLSNLHGMTEASDRSPSLAAVETLSPGNPVLGVVAKGVRRKPVPQT